MKIFTWEQDPPEQIDDHLHLPCLWPHSRKKFRSRSSVTKHNRKHTTKFPRRHRQLKRTNNTQHAAIFQQNFWIQNIKCRPLVVDASSLDQGRRDTEPPQEPPGNSVRAWFYSCGFYWTRCIHCRPSANLITRFNIETSAAVKKAQVSWNYTNFRKIFKIKMSCSS